MHPPNPATRHALVKIQSMPMDIGPEGKNCPERLIGLS